MAEVSTKKIMNSELPAVRVIYDKFDMLLELCPCTGDGVTYGVSRGVLLLTSPIFRKMLRPDGPTSGEVSNGCLQYRIFVREGQNVLQVRSASISWNSAFLLLDPIETLESIEEIRCNAFQYILEVLHNNHDSLKVLSMSINTLACIGFFLHDFQLMKLKIVNYNMGVWCRNSCLKIPKQEPEFLDPWLFISFIMRNRNMFAVCAYGILRNSTLNAIDQRSMFSPDCMQFVYVFLKSELRKSLNELFIKLANFHADLCISIKASPARLGCHLHECRQLKVDTLGKNITSHIGELGTYIIQNQQERFNDRLFSKISLFSVTNMLFDVNHRLREACLQIHQKSSMVDTAVNPATPECLDRFENAIRATFEHDEASFQKNLWASCEGFHQPALQTTRENEVFESERVMWAAKDQWLLKSKKQEHENK